jgi:HAD superfamily hydrolase (TIGR01549 family)
MRVEAVLFDLFNTLVLLESDEIFYTPCLRRLHEFLAGNEINIPFEELRRVYFEVRNRLYAETEKSLEEPHFNVRVSLVLHWFGYDLDVSSPVVLGATMAFTDEFMKYVHLDADTINVLRVLHGKYKLGLVSNFAIPECALMLLDKFGLNEFFDVVLVSGAINKRKPGSEIFDRALKALGVNSSETVFVGDMLDLDVMGAKNVGMKAVLIERRPSEGILNVKPDRVIKTLRELFLVLENC